MLKCYLDTETTGVEIGACVIEIAAILVEDGQIVDTFHEFMRPYRPVHPSAFKAHGISDEFLADKPEEKDVLSNFMEWFVGMGDVKQILAYNAQFDVRIINDRIMRDFLSDEPFLDKNIVVDVAVLAKQAIRDGLIPKNGRKWSQEYVAGCLGITYDAHSAIEDVKAMMRIHEKITKLYEVK